MYMLSRMKRYGVEAVLVFATIAGTAIVGLSAATRPVSAAEGATAEPPAGIGRLFEIGWQRSVQAARAAQDEYDRLKAIHPADSRIDLAFALIQLQQLRYSEAATALSKVLAADKAHLPAWKLKAWTSAITKDFDAAFVEMKQIAALIARQGASATEQTAADDAAVFLGSLCGYFEGPGAAQVNATLLSNTRRDIVKQLSAPQAALFEQARAEVLKQFHKASETSQQSRTTAEEEAAAEKERQLAQLAGQIESAEQAVSVAQSRHDQVQSEVNGELREIRTQQQSLAADRRRVELEGASARREITAIDLRIVELLRLADAEKDPILSQRYRNEAARWRISRDGYVVRLAELERSAAALAAESQSLAHQADAAQNRLQQQAKALAAAQQTTLRLRQQAGRLSGQRISGSTAQVLDLERRRGALTNYVPLPVSLEEEKRRLLGGAPQ